MPKFIRVEEFDKDAVANFEFDVLWFVAAIARHKDPSLRIANSPRLEFPCVWRMYQLSGTSVWIGQDNNSYISFSSGKNSTEEYDWLRWHQAADKSENDLIIGVMGRHGCVCFVPIIVLLARYG